MERVLTGSVQGVFEGLYCMKGMLEPSKSERVCHGVVQVTAVWLYPPFDRIRGRVKRNVMVVVVVAVVVVAYLSIIFEDELGGLVGCFSHSNVAMA